MAVDPLPDPREVIALYDAASQALLRAVARSTRIALGGDPVAGARQAELAARAVAARLDREGPDRIRDAITAAGAQGDAAAVAELAAIGRIGVDAYDLRWQRAAVDRLAAATITNVRPAHEAILRTTVDAYRQVVAHALAPSLTGAETRLAAAQRALNQLAARGISGFVDAAGRNWNLTSYVSMATRTASARAMIEAQTDRLSAFGRDLVVVTGGGAACRRCSPYVGNVLTIRHYGPPPRKRTAKSKGGEGFRAPSRIVPTKVMVPSDVVPGVMVEVDVMGSIASARADGWGHPHCRCSVSMFVPGATDLGTHRLDPDSAEYYDAEQRQRGIERDIRAAKQQAAVAITPQAQADARAHLAAAQADMRAHLEANPDLVRYSYREGLGAR